jgi:hypothetical protein
MGIVPHQCLSLALAAWHQELHGFHLQEASSRISSSTGSLFPYFLIHIKQQQKKKKKKKKKKSFPGFLHPQETGHNRISSSVGRLF